MKITLPRAALFAALGQVKAAVKTRNTIPILGNVRLDADAAGLALTATDLDIEIKTRIDGEARLQGATTVPARMLHEIVRKMPDKAAITLDADGPTLTVTGGASRFALASLPATDFPDLTAGTFPHRLELPAATLARLIGMTAFAISAEETRYYLNGIYLHTRTGDDGPMLRAVATDGHRLARAEIAAPLGSDGMPGVILPTKAIERLRDLAKSHEGNIAIEISPTKIRATAGATTLTSKLIDATFPDYDRVIPRGNDKRLAVDRATIAGAIDRVSTIASDKSRAVRIEIEAERLTMRVVNVDAGQAEETVDATLSGEPITIGFNSRYFAQIVDTLACDRLDIAIGDVGAPILITNPQDASVEIVLMPMRV